MKKIIIFVLGCFFLTSCKKETEEIETTTTTKYPSVLLKIQAVDNDGGIVESEIKSC
jgi:hypothetical protein